MNVFISCLAHFVCICRLTPCYMPYSMCCRHCWSTFWHHSCLLMSIGTALPRIKNVRHSILYGCLLKTPTLNVRNATDYSGPELIYLSWRSGHLYWPLLSPGDTQQGLWQSPVFPSPSSFTKPLRPSLLQIPELGVFSACLSRPNFSGNISEVTFMPGWWSRREGRSQASSLCRTQLVLSRPLGSHAVCFLEGLLPSGRQAVLACLTGSKLEGSWLTVPNRDHHHNRSLLYIASSSDWELGKDGETSTGTESQPRLLSVLGLQTLTF